MAIEERMPNVERLTSLAGFRAISVLGRDAEGIVSFDVVAEETSRPGTLRLAPDAGVGERLLRDARALADLSHPSLPTVQAAGEAPEGAYVVTDEARARTLGSVIESGLPARQAVRMLAEVAEALDVAHGAGLLHGSLRPANLVVGEWLVVRPLLVGLALGRAEEGTSTVADEQMPYAAPELLSGDDVGPPADHYALAATLSELILGAPPFGRSRARAEHGHLHETPPRATDFIPELPPAVDEVFARALAKDPDARYGSATALVTELSRALSGEPVAAAPAAAPAARRRDAAPEAEQAAPEAVAPESEPEPEPELVAEPESEPALEPEPEPVAEPESEPALEPEPEPVAEPEPEPVAAAEVESEPEPDVEPGAGSEPEPQPAALAEPEPEGIPTPPWRAQRAPSTGPMREEPRPPRRRSPALPRGTLPMRAALPILAVAALAGLLLGRAGGEPAPSVSTASAGPISLEVPDGWTRSGEAPSLGRLRLERPVGVAPASGGGVVAGTVRGQAAAFDPRTVAEAVTGSLPQASVVRLGRVSSLRWTGLRSASPQAVTLFVVPISGGAVAVACYGDLPGSVPTRCGAAAGSLRLRGVTPYDPVLAARWRERARAVVRSLRGRRERALARLSETLTSTDHARAADALAQAHQIAIRDLARGGTPPQAAAVGREITASLAGLERSYRRLARASHDADTAAYASASEAVARGDARLRRALRPI